MRVLIISTYFPPLNSIASLRPYSWAKYWAKEGHDVTVLTIEKSQDPSLDLSFDHNEFKIIEVPQSRLIKLLKQKKSLPPPSTSTQNSRLGNAIRAIKKLLIKPFHYLKQKTGVFSGCRMPDFTHLWIKPAIKAVANQDPFDLVVSTAGPYTVHLVAHAIKKQKKAKRWIADYRDPWSDNFLYPGLFPLNWWERTLEKRLLKSADSITTISDSLREMFRLKHGQKVHTVANGFDPEDLQKIDSDNIFPPDGKYRIVYTGTIYKGKRDPTPLFEAINAMEKNSNDRLLLEKLEVIFIGPNNTHLEELIDEHHVRPWVHFKGFLKRDCALRMQRDAHALLFLPWTDMSVDGVLTGKIFEYLFSGTPILAVGGTGMEASQNLIVDAKAGYVFLDTINIINFLRKALSNPCKEEVTLSPDFLSKYHRKALADKMITL